MRARSSQLAFDELGTPLREVTFAKTTFNDIPYKFEAGTPHIAGVIGLVFWSGAPPIFILTTL